MTLIIDSNEYSKLENKINKIFKDVEFEVKPLLVGDYYFDDLNICIERKTVMDFISSVQSNHIFSQAEDMQVFEHKYLFISGKFDDYFKLCRMRKKPIKFTVEKRLGVLCSLSGHYNLKIIQFDNDDQLLKSVLKIHEKTGKAGEITGEIERTTTHSNPNVQVYLSLTGMGRKRAEKLAEIYPNYLDFFYDVKTKGIENIGVPKNIVSKTTITFLEKSLTKNETFLDNYI